MNIMKTSGVVAIDDGGHSTCVVTKNAHERFYSVKGLYGERTLTSVTSKGDFIVEYKGEKYVMGSLAKYDCAMPLQMHTKTKQNLFYDLSVLVALHQYGYLSNYIVTSVPIKMHHDTEKKGRIERLRGSHSIAVNGVTKTFSITDVKVAPETASAFWVNEPKGIARFIDYGSRTVGYATTINEDGVVRFIDTESGSFMDKGLEALEEQYNSKGLAEFVCGRLVKKWDEDDDVFILGGGALDEDLVAHTKNTFFPKAQVMTNPQMVNAIGMYNLGRAAYGMA